ncbi:diacylglycerol kinase [Clostridia bacterium]|nr:diacylglycerol kinase [Clostridia bacterium]
MDKKSLLFLLNPKSGKGQIKNKLLEIIDVFVKCGYEVCVRPTQKAKEVQALLTDISGYDLVVISGGDGTLNEAISGMMFHENRVPIGYIPAGSTNDFAASLRIPKDMVRAARIAATGEDFCCDVGRFNQEYFAYVAAFGLFTEISYETPQEWKNILGYMAYLLGGMKSLQSMQSYAMRIETEERIIEGDFIFGMVTNSISIGGFKSLTNQEVSLDDGFFEVTLIRTPKNPVELSGLLAGMTKLVGDAEVLYSFKARQITFTCTQLVAWTLDGEFGGEHGEAVIQNERRALPLRVGRRKGDRR